MIRVLINYGGSNTNERRIEPGDYDEADPRLFGLADYLKQHGHAVEITVSTPPYIPPKPAEGEQFFTNIDIDEPPLTDTMLNEDEPETKLKGKRK